MTCKRSSDLRWRLKRRVLVQETELTREKKLTRPSFYFKSWGYYINLCSTTVVDILRISYERLNNICVLFSWCFWNWQCSMCPKRSSGELDQFLIVHQQEQLSYVGLKLVKPWADFSPFPRLTSYHFQNPLTLHKSAKKYDFF